MKKIQRTLLAGLLFVPLATFSAPSADALAWPVGTFGDKQSCEDKGRSKYEGSGVWWGCFPGQWKNSGNWDLVAEPPAFAGD